MVRKVITYITYPVLIALMVLCLVAVAQAATGNLPGYAWGENIGWIRLGSYDGGGSHTYANTSATDYGVNRDAHGNLSGYAWGSNMGWINFNPSGGVTIDPDTGHFDGYAWGENIGWIHFKGPGYGVAEYRYVPVGGIAVPVDRLGLVAPRMGLGVLAGLVVLGIALVRRRGG